MCVRAFAGSLLSCPFVSFVRFVVSAPRLKFGRRNERKITTNNTKRTKANNRTSDLNYGYTALTIHVLPLIDLPTHELLLREYVVRA